MFADHKKQIVKRKANSKNTMHKIIIVTITILNAYDYKLNNL